MRTTLTIDDDLLRRAKREAASTGRTLGELVEDALRDSLARRPASPERFRLRRATSGGSGLREWIDLADNGAVRDVMDGLV